VGSEWSAGHAATGGIAGTARAGADPVFEAQAVVQTRPVPPLWAQRGSTESEVRDLVRLRLGEAPRPGLAAGV